MSYDVPISFLYVPIAAYGELALGQTLHNEGREIAILIARAMTGTALNVVSFLFLGFFLGMRHATDADHVVAIATIVSRERSLAGSALIGAAWGVGHTITVMAVGAAIIVFGVVIPPQLGLSMEFAVGIMLVLLGVLTLTGMGRAVSAAHAACGRPRRTCARPPRSPACAWRLRAPAPARSRPGAHGHAEEHTPLARLDRSGLRRIAFYAVAATVRGRPRARPCRIGRRRPDGPVHHPRTGWPRSAICCCSGSARSSE